MHANELLAHWAQTRAGTCHIAHAVHGAWPPAPWALMYSGPASRSRALSHALGGCAQVTDQKVAMEVMLARLGVTAKTNFVHIKGLFDRMDADHSGSVDGDELTRARSTPRPHCHSYLGAHVRTWCRRLAGRLGQRGVRCNCAQTAVLPTVHLLCAPCALLCALRATRSCAMCCCRRSDVCLLGRRALAGHLAPRRQHVGVRRAVTVERILRQKIARGVKEQMLKRFDRNGDGSISPSEFLGKVVSNPMATLYAFQARANPIL